MRDTVTVLEKEDIETSRQTVWQLWTLNITGPLCLTNTWPTNKTDRENIVEVEKLSNDETTAKELAASIPTSRVPDVATYWAEV